MSVRVQKSPKKRHILTTQSRLGFVQICQSAMQIEKIFKLKNERFKLEKGLKPLKYGFYKHLVLIGMLIAFLRGRETSERHRGPMVYVRQESPNQRLHHRVTALFRVEILEGSFNVRDWSLGGLGGGLLQCHLYYVQSLIAG